MKAEAKILKNKLSCQRSERLKQQVLANKLAEGADYIKKCVCNKLFDERTWGAPGGKRKHCTKCPLRPPGRIRTVIRFDKNLNKNTERTYVCKR